MKNEGKRGDGPKQPVTVHTKMCDFPPSLPLPAAPAVPTAPVTVLSVVVVVVRMMVVLVLLMRLLLFR